MHDMQVSGGRLGDSLDWNMVTNAPHKRGENNLNFLEDTGHPLGFVVTCFW